MANSSNRLIVTDIDVDNIKQNLINFLKGQTVFKDYNFEGSALNILMDILAYNTHYNAYYTNMAANEAFADTALLPDNMMSKAKELNYLPRSRSGAVAYINVTITPPISDQSTTFILPAYTKFFSDAVDGTNYPFVTLSSVTMTRANTSIPYSYNNLPIKEGKIFVYTYPAVNLAANPSLRFDMPDSGVDTNTISVLVQQSSVNITSQLYSQATDVNLLTPNSAVYFLEPSSGGKYALQFGDGILGQQLQDGNLITVTYIVTDGSVVNGANNFTYYGGANVAAGTNFSVTTSASASGGSDDEDIESVRFNALKGWGAQNRAVTTNDYRVLIKQNYPYIDALAVWGGQDNNPPVYGAVFVSMKPKAGFSISPQEKQNIINNIIKPLNVLTVKPIIVDPDYTYVRCYPTVHYDSTVTNLTANALSQIAYSAVVNYTNSSLGQFNSTFRLSQLMQNIIESNPAFLGVDMDVVLEKRIIITPGETQTYTINFGSPLSVGSSTQRIYMLPGFNTVDGLGIPRLAYIEEVPLSSSGIDSISVAAPGQNYQSAIVTINGDAPSNSVANATAVIVNGQIQSINLTNSGQGYSFAQIQITDPTNQGFGANAVAVLASQVGQLRSYYYANGQKIILNQNVGTIYYNTGQIILNNFSTNALDGSPGANQIKFIASAQVETLLTQKNTIVVVDTTDPAAIVINVVADK